MAAVVVRKTDPPGLRTAGECVLPGTLVQGIDPEAAVDPRHCTSVVENDRSGVFLRPQLTLIKNTGRDKRFTDGEEVVRETGARTTTAS